MAERIQLRRTKGWRKPEGARVVSRPSRWGNPFYLVDGSVLGRPWGVLTAYNWMPTNTRTGIVGDVGYVTCSDRAAARAHAVDLYRTFCSVRARDIPKDFANWLTPLRGRDLCCWCRLDQPCHADVLIEIANAGGDAA